MKKLLVLLTALCLSMSAILFGMGCNSTKKHDHEAAAEWQTSETQHWHECTFDGCKEKLDLADHTYDQEVAKDEYKKSDATDSAPATYYKSCVCGAKGTETFTKGNANGHTYPTEVEDSAWTWTATETGYTATLTLNCVNGDDVKTVTASVVLSDDEDKTYPADCTYEGLNTYIATVEFNGNTYTAEKEVTLAVDPDAHDTKAFALEPATCFKAGHKAYEYCSSCKKYFEKGSDNKLTETTLEALTLAKLEHDFEHGTHHDAVESTCIDNGNVEYNECKNNCGTVAVKENGEWAIKTEEDVILEKAEHTYDPADPFKCTTCGTTTHKKSSVVSILNEYKGDFTLTFDAIASGNSTGNLWDHFGIYFVPKTEYELSIRDGKDLLYCSATFNDYWWPAAAPAAGTENRTRYQDIGFYQGKIVANVTITRSNNIVYIAVHQKGFDENTKFNAGSVNKTEPEDGITQYITAMMDDSILSSIEVRIQGDEATFSNYQFTKTAQEEISLITEPVTIERPASISNETDFAEMPAGKTQATFEQLLKVGQGLTLEFTHKGAVNNPGNNNWRNYFAYIYAANGNNTHISADNIIARDRGNNIDTWTRADGKVTYNHNWDAANSKAVMDTLALNQNRPNDYDTQMQNCTVKMTVYRMSADKVAVSIMRISAGMKMSTHFIVNTTAAYGSAVENVGFALMTRNADITITSAKLNFAAHAHTYTEVAEVAATCTETGVKAHYICNDCGLTFVKEGDNYVQAPAKDLVIAKVAHSYGDYVTVDANQHKQVCSVCGDEKFGDHVKGDDEHCEYCDYDMSCKHENVELVSAKAATCTEDGNDAYYRCTDCGKLFSDEAHENAIDAPVVIKALGHNYTAEDPFTCTRGDHTLEKNMVSGESVTLLNQYKGDFNLTFKVVSEGDAGNTSYNHFKVAFRLFSEFEKTIRTDAPDIDVVRTQNYQNTYNKPAGSWGQGAAQRNHFDTEGYFKGKVVCVVTVQRIGNHVYMNVNTKRFDETATFVAGSVNTAEPEGGTNIYINANLEKAILSNLVFTTEGETAEISEYTFKALNYSETNLTETPVAIEKPATASNDQPFAEMPDGKEQASFEALLEVGQYVTIELTSKRNPNTKLGNNNWQNYFAYIYAANGENTHIAANNLLARDRGNSYDVWLNKGATYCHGTNGNGGNISVMQVANGNPSGDKYNNAMNDAKATITVTRVSEDTVYYAITLVAGEYKIITNFVINTTGLYGEAVEKVGVAIMTREADVTVTSAKLYTPVTEA